MDITLQVKQLVTEYVEKNLHQIPQHLIDEKPYIISMGTSILCTKWRVGYRGGSFAQAVAANDLMGAMSYADEINLQVLKLYCLILYNVSLPDYMTRVPE